MKVALVLAMTAGASLVGCGHVETHAAMLREPAPPTGRRVELYLAEQEAPARSLYDVAIVQAIGSGDDANPEAVTRALVERAGALGCDAVVRVTIDQGYSRAHAAGVCVKYLGPGPAAPGVKLPDPPARNPTPPPLRPAPAPRIESFPSAPEQRR